MASIYASHLVVISRAASNLQDLIEKGIEFSK